MTLAETAAPLKRTPLYALHRELGARMVPFAGYEMPVQYPTGILAEHLHTRAAGRALRRLAYGPDPACAAPAASRRSRRSCRAISQALAPLRMRYTLLLNEAGGILDDLMATRLADGLFLVVNAARKEADLAHLRDRLGTRATHRAARRSRIAGACRARLQPPCCPASSQASPGCAFMIAAEVTIAGRQCLVTRSGYTGEDGFEISLPAGEAEGFAERLLAEPEVSPIGLGARDSLRLEAGLCLYGHDIDETTTPIEADLAWTIGKRRRAEGGFPGAATILRQLAEGTQPQARRHPSGRPRPGARRHRDRRRRRQQARPSDQRRLRPLGRRRRSRWAMSMPRHAAEGAALCSLSCATSPRPARVVRAAVRSDPLLPRLTPQPQEKSR